MRRTLAASATFLGSANRSLIRRTLVHGAPAVPSAARGIMAASLSTHVMPAEWSHHAGCWMGWPFDQGTWRAGAKPAQAAFVAVASAIAQFEPVTVCAKASQWTAARAALGAHIRVVEMTTDDSWFRDVGPTFVVRRRTADTPSSDGAAEVAGVAWAFDGYTGAYTPVHDKLVAAKICVLERVGCISSAMALEGGGIHVDGEGTLLATEETLFHPVRVSNPGWGKQRVEEELCDKIGVTKVIWLPKGLYGDLDTKGHVDNFCVFARPGVVLLSWTDDESDPQHAISVEALAVLEAATDAAGRRLQVVKLHLPPPMYRTTEELPLEPTDDEGAVMAVTEVLERHDGDRLAASYANFYIANGGIVMPSFGLPSDALAQACLEVQFPGRRVVAVPSREILLGGGNIHCITQQQPSGR